MRTIYATTYRDRANVSSTTMIDVLLLLDDFDFFSLLLPPELDDVLSLLLPVLLLLPLFDDVELRDGSPLFSDVDRCLSDDVDEDDDLDSL